MGWCIYNFYTILWASLYSCRNNCVYFKGKCFGCLACHIFGNPLTYIPIGIISLRTGEFLLASEGLGHDGENLVSLFLGAFLDLKSNLYSIIIGGPVEWNDLIIFYQDVFFPYLIGGIFPGIIAASICWMISLPLIRAYQNRRKGRLREKLREIVRKVLSFVNKNKYKLTWRIVCYQKVI